MSSYLIASEENLAYIAHYGVEGMHWGVRHDRDYNMTPEERAEYQRRRRNRRVAIGAGVAAAAAVGTALAIRGARKRRASRATYRNTQRFSSGFQKVANEFQQQRKVAPKFNNSSFNQVKKQLPTVIGKGSKNTNGPKLLTGKKILSLPGPKQQLGSKILSLPGPTQPTRPNYNYNVAPKFTGDTAKYINLSKVNKNAASQFANKPAKYSGDTKQALTVLKKIKEHSRH